MSGPVDPSEAGVTPVSQREQRTVEGEPQQQPSKAFDLEKPQETTEAAQKPSPMEVTQAPNDLQENLNRVGDKVGSLREELTPERFDQLSPGQKTLLEKKFNQFNSNLQNASSQLQMPYKAPEKEGNPLKTYLGWLTNGQNQIQSIAANLGKKGTTEISPAAMLRAQAQMVAAERAINFASAVAAKSADFIKNMMSAQI